MQNKTPAINEKRPKSKHSAVSIHPLNKAPNLLESKGSQQNEPKSAQQIETKLNSASLNKITVVKLSRKELSTSGQNQSNDDSKINITGTECTDDEIDTLNDSIKSMKDTSIQINDQNITNPDSINIMRRRNSSFNVMVTKVKKGADNNNNVTVNQTNSDLNSSNNRSKNSTPRITRMTTKTKRSAVRPHE